MESERKIEKMLRAYVKKRHVDAGDPLKLHPATRRLLQGEVARRKSKPDDEDASVTLWELFRQRWALFAGFALVIFFGAALFLPALSSAKKKSQTIAAMDNLKQIGLAAQMAAGDNNGKLPASLDALTNELASDKVLTDPETGKLFIYVAGGENLGQLSSNSLLAYSPSDKKKRAALFADGRVEVVNDARLAELTNHELPSSVAGRGSARMPFGEIPAAITVATPQGPELSKLEKDRSIAILSDSLTTTSSASNFAANASSPAAPALSGLTKEPGGSAKDFGALTSSVQFATTQKIDSLAQNSFKNTIAPVKSSAVLANFQVQQNGNTIRVVDADGSVYDGELQPENEEKEQIAIATLQQPAERARTVNRRDEPQTSQNSQALQNYFFQVSGTNLTLKQNVVFAGNVLANSKGLENPQPAYDHKGGFVGAQSQSVLTNQLPWSKSRIAGTALVDTNNIEINAVPLAP